MDRKKKFLIGAAAGLMLVGGVGSAVGAAARDSDPASETRSETTFTEAHRGDVAISAAEAERRAQQAHPGQAFDTHLEDEGHGLVWEVKTDDGTQVWEVHIDPQTGAIVTDNGDE